MNTNQVARIASLVGEPARTAMLIELMDGRALTAHELAGAGSVSPQTGSRHLAQLVEAGLLQVEQRGRHRYHRLASPEVAHILEGIMQLATRAPRARHVVVPGPKDAALRTARTCYDHIAGRLAVAITERLIAERAITFEGGEAGHVTVHGRAVFERMGLAPAAASANAATRRPHCRPCLDWSERKFHVAGRLGALICSHCLDHGWLRRGPATRALHITPVGAMALRGWLGQEGWRRVAEAEDLSV
jgi:DNA-binding transcriptional ArsR family regulator